MFRKLQYTVKSKYFYFFGSILTYIVAFNFFYLKTRGGGFVFDMTEWLSDYILHPNFNYFHPPFDRSFRPVYHFVLYNTFRAFDTDYKAWYILQSSFFIVAGILAFVFYDKLFDMFNIKSKKALAFLAALAFIISPFATENAVWYPTIHYAIVYICCFSILNLMLYFPNNLGKTAPFIFIFFVIALMSIELSYSIIPVSLLTFALLKFYHFTLTSYKKYIGIVLVPQLIMLVLFMAVNKYYNGNSVGHYSIAKVDFDWKYLILHYDKLLVKHLLLINFYGQNIYEKTFNFMDKYEWIFVILSLLFTSFGIRWIYKNRRTISKENMLLLYLLGCSFAFYIPISFLFFHNWKEIELDRLGFGTMMFTTTILILLIYRIKRPAIKYSLITYFFIISALLLQDYTTRWNHSKIVRENYSAKIPYLENKHVYVLGTPIVMRYAYLIAINDSNELYRQLRIFQKKEAKSHYTMMGFYNMMDIDDMVSVEKIDSLTMHFKLQKWGAWCWYNLKSGMMSVKNDKYSIKPDEDNLGYTIHFNSIDSSDRFYIFNRLEFREVKLENHPDGFVYI